MFVRETQPNVFTEIPEDAKSIIIDGTTWPSDIFTSWSVEELAVAHIYLAVPFVPSPGQRTTGTASYHWEDGQVIQTYDTVLDTGPVPESITRRQLILALWQLGLINQTEALAAAQTGTVPTLIGNEFDKLNEPARTTAYITFASMLSCYRDDPTLAIVASSANISDDQMDAWFRWASGL